MVKNRGSWLAHVLLIERQFRKPLAALSLFVVIGVVILPASDVNTASDSRGRSTQVPLHLLYRHFLAYQVHLDQIAQEDFRQGKDGRDFRDHYQRALGFTPAEFAPIRAAAEHLDSELKAQNQKIKAAVDAYRAQTPRWLSTPEAAPPLPAELGQLQQERDAIIENEIARLNLALGPANAARLQRYVRNEVAQHARREQPTHTPACATPPKTRCSHFRMEVTSDLHTPPSTPVPHNRSDRGPLLDDFTGSSGPTGHRIFRIDL